MGFKIKQIQTDNGLEFTNDQDRTNRKSSKKISCNKTVYRRFKSEEEMYKSFERYAKRQNNIAKKVLKFKTANEMLEEYIEKEKARV